MTIFATLTIGESYFYNYDTLTVRGTSARFNSVSNFTANFTNYVGINASSFTVGQEVVVRADKDTNPPTTIIFTGLLEDIQYSGQPNVERITLTGRDYTARLQDSLVQPEVYTNQEVSVIVKDLIDKYVVGITYTNVATTAMTINRIVFKEISVYDAIKQLAEQAGYDFYVDVNKDLHFVLHESVASGYAFDNTNVYDSKFRETDQELYNSVRVYGGTYQMGWSETFNGDGAGSVFTLGYKPFSLNVTVSGTGGIVQKNGGALYQTSTTMTQSGVHYLLNQEDKKVVFTSGTAAGNNIPENGGLITTTYTRAVPIIKWGEDNASITAYGRREKVIMQNEINDPRQARDMVKTTLNESSLPRRMGDLKIYGVVGLQAGQTAAVNLPYEDINNEAFNMIEVRYDFSAANNFAEKVMTVKVADKIRNLVDTLKQMLIDIKRLQANEFQDTDVITRLQYSTGSIGPLYHYYVKTRSTGDSFILGHNLNGVMGSPATSQLGGQVKLGQTNYGSLVNVQSGGNSW